MNRNELKNLLRYIKFLPDSKLSFSQEGEDRLLWIMLDKQPTGFYVDFGAHHPVRFSNTYLFYINKWHGINIDATPGSMSLFNRIRNRDINLEVGIAETDGEMDFYEFKDSALNTFDKERVKCLEKAGHKVINVDRVKVQSANSILEEYTSKISIDFLDIDIEGVDEIIIRSIDWTKFKPRIVLAENVVNDSTDILIRNGYKMIASTTRTGIYLLD